MNLDCDRWKVFLTGASDSVYMRPKKLLKFMQNSLSWQARAA